MQSSPTLVDGTQALTTSYFQTKDRGEETREQRHRRQQNEATARAAEIQKRYDYVMVNSGKNVGSNRNIIQERASMQGGTTKNATRRPPAALPDRMQEPVAETTEQRNERVRREAAAKVAAMKQQLTRETQDIEVSLQSGLITATAPSPSAENKLEQPLEETIEQRQNRLRSEAAAKVAALKQQLDNDEGSRRDLIQERAPAQEEKTDAGAKTTTTLAAGAKPRRYTKSQPKEEAIRNDNPLSRSINSKHPTPPRAPPDSWQAALPEHQMDDKDLAYLQKEGFPLGLIQGMTELKSDFAKQIWIVDNSESMTMRDGTILADAPSGGRRFTHKCSRWDELQECVSSHIRLSGALRQPTSFRLLNDPGPSLGPQKFGICESALSTSADIQGEVKSCLEIMARNSPRGQTPLTQHIKNITAEVNDMRAGLLASGKRVAIVICTDGVPTDATREDFLVALRKLETLPVWLVIRLCTNEPHVVEFYNELDAELKISVDVIDDFQGEALDICKHNPWLNYALPLHRARERGFHTRVLDFLDECPLSGGEQKEVCGVLFGKENMEGCPDPGVDMPRFLVHIDSLQENEQLQWDPIDGKVQPWVDLIGNPKSKRRKMGNMKRKKTTSFFGCFGM